MSHWTERMFLEQADAFRPHLEGRADRAPEQVEDLLALVAETYDHDPASVLDVACGVGRHLVPFAEAGLHALGVDLSPEYVEAARERAADAGVADRVTVTEGDMRELGALDGAYDLVTSFWTSVGYFDREGNRAVFEGMYDRLAPGGVVALELANKEGVLADYADSSVHLDGDRLEAERREYDPVSSRMESTLYTVDVAAESLDATLSWDVRLYAPVDLRERLVDAGFADPRFFATLDGESLTLESTRMVALARKPV